MLFDVITIVILFFGFRVLPRLISRRRGDVLYYVSKPDPLGEAHCTPVAALANGLRRRAVAASMRYPMRATPLMPTTVRTHPRPRAPVSTRP